MKTLFKAAALVAAVAAPAVAQAQPPAAAPAAPAAAAAANPLVSQNPTYVAIPMEVMVNKPAKDVWARVGKYCDIAEWLQIAAGCQIVAGKDGEVGAVRTVGNEVLVGKTELSYTYTQTVKNSVRPTGTVPYNLYHGTLEARPVTATTSKLVYTLMMDNSMVPEANRQATIDNFRTRFTQALNNMKTLAEGGKLPPPPARPAAPAAPAAPR